MPLDYETVNFLATVATPLTLLVALVFGVVQTRQNRRNRRDAAAIEIIRAIQGPEFLAAMEILQGYADRKAPTSRSRLAEYDHAARTVGIAFEALGYMVYRRMVPLEVVDELIGGDLRDAWRRLEPLVVERRAHLKSNKAYEWFQWLVERVAETPAPRSLEGAHVSRRNWKP